MSKDARGAPVTIRIDEVAARLWRGEEAIALRPKTWAVLCYLSKRPGALVTKTELLDAIWPDTAVSEGTLNKSIAELRLAVGDDRSVPRYIETVSRRGFRWIGEATPIVPADIAPATALSITENAKAVVPIHAVTPPPHLVGREKELDALDRCFARAAAGTRQVVFVTGEAGAGKSTLADAFATRLEQVDTNALHAHGQCIESFGQHEPYRPMLEAIERLARRSDIGATIVSALRSHAPTWLRQMPSLSEAEPSTPGDDPVTPARMLREISAALEEISRDRPLVMILEDAHWADHATIDACNLLARRRDPARLMLVVTMRTADALVAQHPALTAKIELTNRSLATELAVALFTPAFVQEYLAERCCGLELDPELAGWIHHQTAGNPLFVRIVVDELTERGILAPDDDGRWKTHGSPRELREFVPDSLRDLVERQLDRLSPAERNLAEAACVLPMEFSVSTAALLAGLPEEEAEDICSELARRGQILRRAGRVGSRSSRFSLVHSMVQRILLDRIPPKRLRRLHLAAAEQLEHEHPDSSDAVAVQLALHYAMAEDPAAAILHLQRAAASIQRIPAPREVVVICEQILDLVERNPNLPDHRRKRIVATMNLAEARQLANGIVDAETNTVCEKVIELAVSEEDARERFMASMGVFSNRFYTGRYEEAHAIGSRLLVAAERYQHPFMIKSAEFAVAGASYRMGRFAEARAHFESCLRHSADSQQTYGWDFQSMSLSHLALLAVHFGEADVARRLIGEAQEHGRRSQSPDAAVLPMLAYALTMLRDDASAMTLVELSLSMSDRIGAAAWIERARFLYGLLLSRQGQTAEGVRRMKEALARQARQPLYLDRTAYCALLADELMRRELPGAQPIVDEGIAFMERSGERCFEAELYRLRGNLRLAAGNDAGVATAGEADLRRALETARSCGTRLNELVAATSLARLLQRQTKSHEARELLEKACHAVESADDLTELREARELLASL